MDWLLAGADGAAVYEELRFVWELMAAELVFLLPFASRRAHFVPKVALGLAGFSLWGLCYFRYSELVLTTLGLDTVFVAAWYIVLAFVMMLYARWCFELSLADALYVGLDAYAAQHIVYVVVHEALALALWPELPANLVLYNALSTGACVVCYGALWRLFAPRLAQAGGHILRTGAKDVAAMVALMALFMGCSFGFQHLFHLDERCQANAVVMSVAMCLMLIFLQYATLRATLEDRERAATEQMLRDAEGHWQLSNELIENLNRTVHDLKHVVAAMDRLPEAERAGYVNQTTEYIKKYEQAVYSKDSVLNTLLSEKTLLCESRGVRLSCSLGNVDLGFIALPDLCVLLGNMVDNALEGSLTLPEERADERAISLAIKERGGLLCITCDNRFEGERSFADGLPQTTKADASRHGFGVKSMRLVAERYGGVLTVDAEGGVFTVQVAIPLP